MLQVPQNDIPVAMAPQQKPQARPNSKEPTVEAPAMEHGNTFPIHRPRLFVTEPHKNSRKGTSHGNSRMEVQPHGNAPHQAPYANPSRQTHPGEARSGKPTPGNPAPATPAGQAPPAERAPPAALTPVGREAPTVSTNPRHPTPTKERRPRLAPGEGVRRGLHIKLLRLGRRVTPSEPGAPHPRGERRPCAARWCIGQGAERGAAGSLPTGVLRMLRSRKIRPGPADDLLRRKVRP